MATVCVFCGSRPGDDPRYMAFARRIGTALAGAGHRIVYGGASVGCMGAVADAALAAGGEVEGVIPRKLVEHEVAHPGLTTLHIVETMAERKDVMVAKSDAYVVLPGSIGTLDELFEVWTLSYLKLVPRSRPPLWLVDPSGYWDPLVKMIERMRDAGFMAAETVEMVGVLRDEEALLVALRSPGSGA